MPTNNDNDKVICTDCGGTFNLDNTIHFKGEDYCVYCYTERFIECEFCHTMVERDETTLDSNGYIICDDCVDNHFTRCEDCGELMRNTDTYIVYQDAEENSSFEVCESCLQDYYYCEQCYHWFTSSCGKDYNGEWHCYSCRRPFSAGVIDYHEYPWYLYEPRNVFGEDDVLYMGVELEVDNGNFDIDDFHPWTDDELIHFENDGSLDNGVECITQPCSLRYHQEKFNWKRLLEELGDQGFKSHDTDTCGLHVHLSRNAFAPLSITKLDVFLHRAWWFFSQIGRRDHIYGDNGKSGDKNRKLSLWKDVWSTSGWKRHSCMCRRCCHTLSERSSFIPFNDEIYERYQIVNTNNAKTVELRHAKGTLKYQTLIGTLEMYHALVKFIETVTLLEVRDKTHSVLIKFIDYLFEKQSKYPHVIDMISSLLRDDSSLEFAKIRVKKIKSKSRIGKKLEKKGN